jgi:hypothetical protein
MFSQSYRHEPFYRCEVTVDAATEPLLRMMGADGRITADHFMVRGCRAIMVLSRNDVELLRKMGFAVSVGADMIEQARRVRAEIFEMAPFAGADGLQMGFVNQYLDSSGIKACFETLHNQFPSLTQWSDLPYSTSGYDGSNSPLTGPAKVKLFRINTTPAVVSKPGLLLIAGTHAREWVPPLGVIEFASQLLRNYSPGSTNAEVQKINQLVEGLDIFIVPALNPDGINYSHYDDSMWRRNRSPNSTPSVSCRGVDINRNYSIYWGEGGSSENPCNDAYRGPIMLSEPENRNIVSLLEQYPNILTGIDCHSFGENIFRPQPTGGAYINSEPVESHDHAVYLSLETAMNTAISAASPGKTYTIGTTNNHAGTSDEYLFFGHRIFAFDLECARDFQPPISDALTSVQEVAAAVRALGEKTLALAGQFTFPVDIAHLIDRSGSMIASGYIDATKANAKRMVDLMSLNDAVTIASFNENPATHMGLTVISGPGVFAGARAAIDAITPGGWTSIGAGLQAAGSALAGGNGPKAIILLSDGHQNRSPWVADALPTLPVGTKVYTIALGPQSDLALLSQIAADTGGSYAYSPGELELHEIYNYIRASATDEELALNESLILTDADETATRQVMVDEGAAYGLFSVSWGNPAVDLKMTLHPPNGRVMDQNLVRETAGSAYKVLRLRRPQAGLWSVEIQRRSGRGAVHFNVAAFLRSDLRLRLVPAAQVSPAGEAFNVLIRVHDQGKLIKQYNGKAQVGYPAASVASLLNEWKNKLPAVPAEAMQRQDALPKPFLQALLIREQIIKKTQQDPLRHIQAPAAIEWHTAPMLAGMGFTHVQLASMGLLAPKDAPITTGLGLVAHQNTAVPGAYNVRVRVEGCSEVSGRSFVRLGLRSVLVQ